jgi:hypothetical protein
MYRVLVIVLILFFAACSNRQSSPLNEKQKQTRFYDYELSIEFLDPFLGLERSYAFHSNTLIVLSNSFSKDGKLKNTDSITVPVTKPQLDTIYTYAAELFTIDKENFTDMPIPGPPYGEGNLVRVTFDLNFRGDKYVRELQNVDTTIDNSFSRLYRFILKVQRSR